MKKILLVITKSNWGGAQRYVYNLATALPREEYAVTVALGPAPEGAGVGGVGLLAEKLTAAGIRVLLVPSFQRDVSLVADLHAYSQLQQLFARERPDVVHLNSSKAGGIGALAARRAGVPTIIFTSHGLAWDEDRSALARSAIKVFSWFTFLLCHTVITISRDNFERVRALPFCTHKVVLIHNGLPELSFEARERARVSLALKAGLTDAAQGGALWVGTIAELTRNKGLAYLIEAVGILKSGGVVGCGACRGRDDAPALHPHVFIVGTGEEEAALRALIARYKLEDSVHLLGFVPDAYRYDKAFNIFVLASVKEGLPTVLLEVGQAGLPVVASDIPGCREIVTDGESGLLAEPKNAHDLAHALARLLEDHDLRHRLAKRLRATVTRDFSLEKMVAETKKLY